MRQLTETTKARQGNSWRGIARKEEREAEAKSEENSSEPHVSTFLQQKGNTRAHTNQIQPYKRIEKEPQDDDATWLIRRPTAE